MDLKKIESAAEWSLIIIGFFLIGLIVSEIFLSGCVEDSHYNEYWNYAHQELKQYCEDMDGNFIRFSGDQDGIDYCNLDNKNIGLMYDYDKNEVVPI